MRGPLDTTIPGRGSMVYPGNIRHGRGILVGCVVEYQSTRGVRDRLYKLDEVIEMGRGRTASGCSRGFGTLRWGLSMVPNKSRTTNSRR